MTALLEVSLDVRPTAQSIITSVLAGDAATAVSTMNDISNDELYAVVLLLASSVDTGAPLMPVPWEKVSHDAVVKFARIVSSAAAEFDVDEADIYSRSNLRTHAHARQVACYVAMVAGLQNIEVARILSRDHSTIHHAYARVSDSKTLSVAAAGVIRRIAESKDPR